MNLAVKLFAILIFGTAGSYGTYYLVNSSGSNSIQKTQAEITDVGSSAENKTSEDLTGSRDVNSGVQGKGESNSPSEDAQVTRNRDLVDTASSGAEQLSDDTSREPQTVSQDPLSGTHDDNNFQKGNVSGGDTDVSSGTGGQSLPTSTGSTTAGLTPNIVVQEAVTETSDSGDHSSDTDS